MIMTFCIVLAAATILIPDDRPFTKSVRDCLNYPFTSKSKPDKICADLVDFELLEAVSTVEKECAEEGIESFHRVPPLVYSRLARGGKSTFLRRLFDELKRRDYTPIAITFNGYFALQRNETGLEALLRLIALQLTDLNTISGDVKVSMEKLLEHIDRSAQECGSKGVVLLIDELNELQGGALDPGSSVFLKKYFLDKASLLPVSFFFFNNDIVDVVSPVITRRREIEIRMRL
jgi:hypothetical protein